MATQMSEKDWGHTLMVLGAWLPRRGRKAADDRKLLEVWHFFTVETVRWRALPKECANSNTVWKRFERPSKAGGFEAFFDMLASMSPSAHPIRMFDSTIVPAVGSR